MAAIDNNLERRGTETKNVIRLNLFGLILDVSSLFF